VYAIHELNVTSFKSQKLLPLPCFISSGLKSLTIRTIGHAAALLVVLKKASMSALICSVGAYATFPFSAFGCALACFDLMRAAEDAPSSDNP
jgi:hypothetical protein